MASQIIITATLLLTFLEPMGALSNTNFAPISSFYESEGIRFPNVIFHDGRDPVAYVPPTGWRSSGGVEQCTFYPPESVNAAAAISAMPKADAPTLSAETVGHYEDIARNLLPKESSKAALLSTTFNPVRICGRTTVEYVFEFVISSQRCRASYLLMPREHDIIRLTLFAPPEKFEELHMKFLRSMYTLQGL